MTIHVPTCPYMTLLLSELLETTAIVDQVAEVDVGMNGGIAGKARTYVRGQTRIVGFRVGFILR